MREHRFFLTAVIALVCSGLALGTEGSKPRKKEEGKPEQKQPAKPEKKSPEKQPEKKPEKQPEKKPEKQPEKKPEKKPEPKPEKKLEKLPESKAEAAQGAPQPGNLAELDWLIGEWYDEGMEKGIQVRNVFRWNSKRTFLIRSYQVEEGNELTRQGTQMIGWDPVNQQIRSWIFGNEGGFAEGFWIVQHHGFQATLNGTMPDGGRALVTQILKRTGEHTMASELVGVEIDGQRQPAQPVVKMRRVTEKSR